MSIFLKTNSKIDLLENRIVQLEARINELEELLKNKDISNNKSSQPEKDKATDRDELSDKKIDETVSSIMKLTGWDYPYAKSKFLDAHSRTKCTPREYLMYRFYELSDSEQESYFLVFNQKHLHKKYEESRKFTKLVRNKEKTNQYFSKYVRRPWCTNQNIAFDDFKEIFKNSSRLIYKPIDGHCGYGVKAFDIDVDNLENVYNELFSYPEGIIEEFIKQHADMSKLCSSCINSLRFVTISSNKKAVSEDGNKVEIVYSIVRIGRGNSIVDNLHSGGMVANVDMETGTISTNACGSDRKEYITHPETGTIFKGFQIPFFFEALDMIREAIESKNVAGYLGWDIAISENGPMLLEVNNRPGADGLQAAYSHERKGMKHVMQKFL